jgi:hypothetical protein
MYGEQDQVGKPGQKGNDLMSDLDNFELNEPPPSHHDEPSLSPDDKTGRRRRTLIVIVVLLIILAAVIAGWMWSRRTPSGSEVDAVAEEPAVQAEDALLEDTAEEVPPLELPSLDASDVLVRELAAALSANPQFASWLVNEDLVRRFVVAVDNIAEGESPRVHLGFMAPKSAFKAWESDGSLHVSPTSYRRYDAITEAFVSLDSQGSIELYRRLEPLVREAYRDLGYPQRSFEDVLRRAAEVVLDTPQITGPVELEAAVRSYRFADPQFEGLDPIQKQLLRFGPRNLGRIQAKVRALVLAMDASG